MEHNLLLPSWERTYRLPAGTFEDDARYLDPRNVPLDKVSGRRLRSWFYGFSDHAMKLVFVLVI